MLSNTKAPDHKSTETDNKKNLKKQEGCDDPILLT